MEHHACHDRGKRPDFLLWGSLVAVIALYADYWRVSGTMAEFGWYGTLTTSVFQIMNTIWWGIALGIVMVSVLSRIPRAFVLAIFGTGSGITGILRATLAGVLLDLCSHGILMVGAKLYERGVSIGKVIAFLLASPWNSFSLTFVLIALIGLPWTLTFIGLSMLVAISVGCLFDKLVDRGILPDNTNTTGIPEDFEFWRDARTGLLSVRITPEYLGETLRAGIVESRMVVRWILFGVLLASLIRALVPVEYFETLFGPTILGLGLTVLAATVVEVCSEGSTPVAADLINRAGAPGNSFTFLMAGVATDYTEVMVLKDATASWKIALFLPLLTVPQVLIIGYILNQF